MIAVAVVALLIPTPREAVWGMAEVLLAVWGPAILVELMIYEIAKGTIVVKAVLAAATGGLSLLLVNFVSDLDTFGVVVMGLTPLNLVRPFYAAWRLRRDMHLAAGEADLGLARFRLVGLALALASACQGRLDLMAQLCRMSLVATLLLARYGLRPVPPGLHGDTASVGR